MPTFSRDELEQAFRAYWRTALTVIFRPKLFREQIDNPIELSDARRFWLLTIVFAYLPVLGAAVQIVLDAGLAPHLPGGFKAITNLVDL